jgi:uncharacterized protein YjbJ (UPF0337 family)
MKKLTEIRGNWIQTKAKLKIKFAILTDNDLLIIEGKQDEMFGRLETKLGKTREEVFKLIASL